MQWNFRLRGDGSYRCKLGNIIGELFTYKYLVLGDNKIFNDRFNSLFLHNIIYDSPTENYMTNV